MENNDVFVAIKMKADISYFSFTRSDVVVQLMKFAAAAAAVFGPCSDEVMALEGDIEEVKSGDAILSEFTWCFPQMDGFQKVEA